MRYGHDTLKTARRHVILMSRSDPSRIVAYDEVVTSNDPENSLSTFLTPKQFITDYKDISNLDGQVS